MANAPARWICREGTYAAGFMKIFLYEFVTGGGNWTCRSPLAGSLLAEARAMAQAVATDFAALKGVEVFTTRDTRLPALHPAGCRVTLVASSDDEHTAIRRLARSAIPSTEDAGTTPLAAPTRSSCLTCFAPAPARIVAASAP